MDRCFVLYSCPTQLTLEHWPVVDNADGMRPAPRIYVRAVLVNCHYNEGLDHVKPMDGETFLNSVPA